MTSVMYNTSDDLRAASPTTAPQRSDSSGGIFAENQTGIPHTTGTFPRCIPKPLGARHPGVDSVDRVKWGATNNNYVERFRHDRDR